MPQVTKNYSIQFKGLSISADGQFIGASIAWQDEGGKKPNVVPGSIKHLRVATKTGAVELNGTAVGSLDAATAKSASAVAAAMKTLVQSLSTSGKIPTP
jgi:hypothetical protein